MLSLDSLNELKGVVEYVALRHSHRHFEIENWTFDPSSIELTNIGAYRESRGVFIVEIAEDNSIDARHIDEYFIGLFSV